MRDKFHTHSLAKIKKYDNNEWWHGCKRTGHSYTVGRSVKALLWKMVLHCFVKLKDVCPLPQQIPSCNLKQWFSKCGPHSWLAAIKHHLGTCQKYKLFDSPSVPLNQTLRVGTLPFVDPLLMEMSSQVGEAPSQRNLCACAQEA